MWTLGLHCKTAHARSYAEFVDIVHVKFSGCKV